MDFFKKNDFFVFLYQIIVDSDLKHLHNGYTVSQHFFGTPSKTVFNTRISCL